MRAFCLGLLAVVALSGCERFAPTGVPPTQPQNGLRVEYAARQPHEMWFTAPVTDGKRIYTPGLGFMIMAIDRKTGQHVWTIQSPDQELLGFPVYHRGRILTASDNARAWDAETGAMLWERPLTIGSPRHHNAAADGLFFAGLDSVIVAFDVVTGDRRWERIVGPGWAYAGRVSALSTADGMLYGCLREPVDRNGVHTIGHVVALVAATGEIRWRYRMAFETNFNFCMGEPLPAGDMLIVADAGGNNFVGLDRATGEFRWRHQGEPGWVGPFTPPSLSGDTLFATSLDASVVALHRKTGRVLWQSRTNGTSARHAVACGRVVIVSTIGSLHVFDRRTGRSLSTHAARDWAPNSLVPGRVLVEGDTAFAVGGWNLYRIRCSR